jgi:hypothetical protein
VSPLVLTLLLSLVPAGEPEVKLVAGPPVRRLPQQISSLGFFKGLNKGKISFDLFTEQRTNFKLLRSLAPLNLFLLCSSVADPDPGSGAFLTPGSGIRDPE